MTGRRERERKAARERSERVVWSFDTMPTGSFFIFRDVNFGERRQPRTGEKFTVDHDGTIILHPSQWKVIA